MTPTNNERADFEAWASRHHNVLLERSHIIPENYWVSDLQSAWEAWQARASLAANAPAAPTDVLPVAWRYQTPTGWHATTDPTAAMRVSAHHPIEPLYTAPPAPTEQWLSAADLAALQRAEECLEDGEGHDLPKLRVARLIEIGVMRHNGGGYYSITSFGRLVLGGTHLRKPLETVDECNDRLSREHRAKLGTALCRKLAQGWMHDSAG